MNALAFALVIALAATHVFAGRLRFLSVQPRSRWLSAAGGICAAYVFVHILPDLARHRDTLAESLPPALAAVEHHVYLVALAGLVVFYGLERLAKASRRRRPAGEPTTAPVFWIHTASFAVYNILIGYLSLHRETAGRTSLLLFTFAMATHFLVNDHGLRQDHRERYDRVGRWLLGGAVLVGWGVGAVSAVPPAAVATLFAFLAGGVILNVMKEELPEERESRFSAFAMGAAGDAALVVADVIGERRCPFPSRTTR